MATPSWTLWLLVAAGVMSQGCCQHWSYGLSPGGKRDLDLDLDLDPLDTVVEGFPLPETSCGVLGCAEEAPPFPRMYGRRGFISRRAGKQTQKI